MKELLLITPIICSISIFIYVLKISWMQDDIKQHNNRHDKLENKGCLNGKTQNEKERFFASLHSFIKNDLIFYNEQLADLQEDELEQYNMWIFNNTEYLTNNNVLATEGKLNGIETEKFEIQKDLIGWIETMHLQNTNGRETGEEMFRLGIEAALEELSELKLLK